jgi:signal transduction histidine kinase
MATSFSVPPPTPALVTPAAEPEVGTPAEGSEGLRARTDAAAALRQSEARYRALFATMEQGFCLLEKVATAPGEPSDYRYLAINPAFMQHTGLPDVTGQMLRQVVPGVEPHIVALYDEVIATGEHRRVEEYVAVLDRWIAAEILPDLEPNHLALLFSNVTARRRAEQALRESEARQAYLLALSDALQPVAEACAVQATVTAMRYFGADRCCYCEIDGDTVTIRCDAARPGLPSMAAVYSLRAMPLLGAILRGGHPVVVANVLTSIMGDGLQELCLANSILAYINVPVMRNDELLGSVLLAQSEPRDWTVSEVALIKETAERAWAALERTRAKEALRHSEEQFRLLVTATFDTVYSMSADWTQLEQLLGKDFLVDTLSPIRTWPEKYLLADDQRQARATINAAIRAKRPFELEHRVRRADGTIGWAQSRTIPMLGTRGELLGWLGAANDVSARKEAEQQLLKFNARLERQVAERTQALQESRDLLHAVAESQTMRLSAFTAVRDAQHQLIEVMCIFANSSADQLVAGRPVVGQHYLGQFSGAERARLLALFRRVIDTDVAEEWEVVLPDGQPIGWARILCTKLGDGVLVSSEDITPRKQAEQARNNALRLLEQSEAMAALGSWDYDLATQTLTWSNGMYRLFDLPPGSPISPQCYLDVVVAEDRAVAEQLVRNLLAGAGNFEKTLRLRVGEASKVVCIKAVVVANEQGQPERVLGVDLDISEAQRLQAENRSLQFDRQKELLLAILQAQEAERKRLAETLHNGLGQVLYATKLHFNQLDMPALHAVPTLSAALAHSKRLLAEAIHLTRTLAHELVPSSLEKFGLATALQDICRDLSTAHVRLTCHVWLDEQALLQPVQVALYRMAQELAHNILKHAGATQALLELETIPGWVVLRAEDDGRGFNPTATSQGLGLRMLHEAVELLGGTVTIDSSPAHGTHIRLRIPISPLSS